MSTGADRPSPAALPATGRGALGAQLLGGALFLFIPVVLFLFVAHPAPVAGSLAAGLALMLGHRALARPYMLRVRERKCLWCNRAAPAGSERLRLATGAGAIEAAVCPGHGLPAARFLTFLERHATPLRAGVFAPLLLLLAALAAAAAGRPQLLPAAVALFQLVVGATVNAVAFGHLRVGPAAPLRVPFPAHNFFLLGIRNLLWVFRLVGAWWIVRGAAALGREALGLLA